MKTSINYDKYIKKWLLRMSTGEHVCEVYLDEAEVFKLQEQLTDATISITYDVALLEERAKSFSSNTDS